MHNIKQIILNSTRNNLLLFAILFFSLITRTMFLNQFPIGMTHDELNYIIAAKSLFWTGNFAPGTAPAVFPTQMAQFTVTVAEVPALLLAPLIGPLETSLFTSRFLGALLSTLIILAVYFLVKRLTGRQLYAFVCALVMIINPWSFLMGRTIFEVNFFVAFFLWGFLILLGNRGWKIFYAFPLYALGFASYTGGQVAFYLFIIITLIYHYCSSSSGRQFIKSYLLFFCLATIMLVGYANIILHNQSYAARGGEIITPQSPEIAKIVDHQRQLAIQSPSNQLFINKATVYVRSFLDKYLNAFSVNNLFINGEFRAAFSYQQHGTFYAVDLLFIILGLVFLFAINKKVWLLILAIIVVSPITSGLSVVEYSYSQRAGLMFPFLAILTGLGVGSLTTLLKPHWTKNLLLAGVGIIYVLMFINLLHLYFFRFPIYASDGWFFQDRTLGRYVQLTSEKYPHAKIIVTTFEPKIVFQQYLFFTRVYHGKQVTDINSRMSKQDYSYKNVTFTNSCPDKNLDTNVVWISDSLSRCQNLSKTGDTLRITRFKDVYEHYLIKQDLICRDQPLGSYVSPAVFQHLDLEKQTADQFCQNWITRL